MREQVIAEFKNACKEYLSTQSIERLRSYGREIGVKRPTTKPKNDLIELIVGVLVGEIEAIPVAKRGAPVKNNYVDPKIAEEIEKLYDSITRRYITMDAEKVKEEDFQMPENPERLDVVAAMDAFRKQEKNVLRVADPNAIFSEEETIKRKEYKGQLNAENGVFSLLPLDCGDAQPVMFPVDIVHLYGLREGDVISCYAERSRSMLICEEILNVNGAEPHKILAGFNFEKETACYPFQRIHTLEAGQATSATAKYFQWLLPLGRGQRGCIFSAPKAGKTRILLDIAEALANNTQDLTLFTLLVDQSPESVHAFRSQMANENLLYTTYDEEAERQVFVADFMLKRAKRCAELGKDVVLLIDSLSALARAYNDTDDSLGGRTLNGGLESKTVHYIKKYLGSARCFEKGGSLTIIAAVSCATGSPFDDILTLELENISNLDIWLNEKNAMKRIYPAIDLQRSFVKYSEILLSAEEEDRRKTLLGRATELGTEALCEKLASSSTFEMLLSKLNK